jgi:arylsulfatase
MLGSRGIYHDEWKAVTFKPLGHMYDDGLDPDAPFEDDIWELYHVSEDLTECNDLAATNPEKLQELVALWWREAEANQVLPLDNRPLAAILNPRPRRAQARSRYTYFANGSLVPEDVAVNVRRRSHTITASVDIPDRVVPEGVLLAIGSVLGGFSFLVLDGCLHYVHNLSGVDRYRVTSTSVVPSGTHELAFECIDSGNFSGTGRLLIDGELVGEGPLEHLTPMRFSVTGGGLTCGYELGPAVGTGYEAPFRFNATLHKVVVDVEGSPMIDPEAEFNAIMSEQ